MHVLIVEEGLLGILVETLMYTAGVEPHNSKVSNGWVTVMYLPTNKKAP